MASQGRPVWNSGNCSAQATAKSVIASAARLIDMRHCWRNRNRIAEMSVPAWPMPIHQTKLMMSKPHPTGMLMPQMPTPLNRSIVTVMRNSCRREKPIANPEEPEQRRPRREDDAADLLGDGAERLPRRDHRRSGAGVPSRYWVDSVAMGFLVGLSQWVGGSVRPCRASAGASSGFGFRTAARYVVRGRVLSSPSTPYVARLLLQLRHPRLRIVDVAEHDRRASGRPPGRP